MVGFSGDPVAWNKLRALKDSSAQSAGWLAIIAEQMAYQSQLLYNIHEMMKANLVQEASNE